MGHWHPYGAAHTWRVFEVEAEGPGGVHASTSLAYLAGQGG